MGYQIGTNPDGISWRGGRKRGGGGGEEGGRTEREDEIDKREWEEGGSKIPWEEYDGREGG